MMLNYELLEILKLTLLPKNELGNVYFNDNGDYKVIDFVDIDKKGNLILSTYKEN